ncbi:MAG: hypothetical protein GYB17_14910 [Gammaproteobacteria bacterium]|nr:hypothetical protein [Gammaproteobacteria bacterium]
MRSFLLGLVALFPLTAAADDIPRFDVETHCEMVASIGGEFSNMTYNGCIQMEQSAYNRFRTEWDSIPGGIRRQCEEVATVTGSGSYSTLGGCIDMETQAADNKQTFTFD